MDYLGAAFIVIGFVFLIKRLRLIENSVLVVSVARQAVADIGNPDMPDESKEAAVQQHALQLLKLFFVLAATAFAAVGLPVVIIWLFDWLGLLSFDRIIEITLSLWFLVLSTILVAAFFWMTKSRR